MPSTPTRVVAHQKSAAAQLNQFADFLEGTAGYALAYFLRTATGENFTIELADNGGDSVLQALDSDGEVVMSLDSDGNLTVAGAFVPGSFSLPLDADPTQTGNGVIAWDSDDFQPAVGTGAATLFFESFTKGSDLASASTLSLTAGYTYFHVTGTTTITSISARRAGSLLRLEFDDVVQLTYGASTIITPDKANYRTTAGEVLTLVAESTGWRVLASSLQGFDRQAAQSRINTNTGQWKGHAHFKGGFVLPSATDEASGVPLGDGFTWLVSGAGAADLAIPSTVNDQTKTMQRIVTGTSSANAGRIFRYWGIDPATDDFDLSVVISLDNNSNRFFFFGLMPATNNFDANGIIGFRVTNNGNIIAVSDNGGTESTRDSGLAGSAAPGTLYVLRMVGTAGTVKFYVNGTQVGADVTTNLSTTAVYVQLVIETTTTAAAEIHFRDLYAKMRAN